MKCLGRLESMALAAAVVFSACSGDTGPDKAPGEEMPKVNPDSFLRNPEHPLSCDRAITENPLTSPLFRLTDEQYENTLRELFAGLVQEADLPKARDLPTEATEGLFSNDTSIQRLSGTRADLYESFSYDVAAKAVNDLPKLMGCEAKNEGAEAGCVSSFVDNFGVKAWRRPITSEEKQAIEGLYASARKELDFKTSVQAVVAGFIGAPQFLYRLEEGTGGETESKARQLSGYEMASRLSYLIWDSMPDANLFQAAKAGKLSNAKDVQSEAQRMLEDPRARGAVANFYHQWLHLERVESRLLPSKKDTVVYPDYGDVQYQGLLASLDAFMEDAFWEGDRSMKRLFTSNRGFVNDATAKIFGVEAPGSSDIEAVDLPMAQRQGLLTQAGFMAGWAHATEQAPILRGAFIMENILCSPPPMPPDDVNLELKPVENRDAITYREFVTNTVERGTCKGCHEVIDGFGFLFENYDGIGAFQTKERHLDIDASNTVIGTYDLDGPYENGVDFSQALAKSEQAAQCMVEKFYQYAMARQMVAEDGCAIAPLTDEFIADGLSFPGLVAKLVRSPAFRFRSTAK